MKWVVTSQVILSIILCTGGIGTGFYLAKEQTSTDEHSEEAPASVKGLSPQSLKNMGVTVAPLKKETYMVTERIPALVTVTPTTDLPLSVPIAGRILTIDVQLGQHVKPGQVLATLLRDPVVRPELKVVEELLRPASEEYHNNSSELSKAAKALSIVETELKRLNDLQEKAGAIAVVPRQSLIDLQYEKMRTEEEIRSLRAELKLHGLSDEQVKQLEAGKKSVLNLEIWHAVLKRNGIWNARAEKLHEILEKEGCDGTWGVAIIGELVAQGLVSEELERWMSTDKKTAAVFISIAAQLLEGQSLTTIKWLHTQGAFEPIVQIRAPKSATGWDVIGIHGKAQAHLDSGAKIVTLSNPDTLYLEARPLGTETVSLTDCLKLGLPIKATPQVKGVGPELNDLTLTSISHDDDGHVVVRVLASNTVLTEIKEGESSFRSWNLRPGMKYMLQVPVRKLDDVFIVPSDAVAANGPDKLIYVKSGKRFQPAKVVVLHETVATTVLGPESDVFPGDVAAMSGAFALKLALSVGEEGAIDPHAGHNH